MHVDTRRLSALAYPDTDHKTRELLSCDHFFDALADPVTALKIRERRPRDLDSALQIALELEVWAKDSERLAQSMGRALADSEEVYEFTRPGFGQQWGKQGKNSADIQNELAVQHKLLDEQRQEIAELKSCIQIDISRLAPPSGAKPWQKQSRASFYCWGCGQHRHTAKNCPEHAQQDAVQTGNPPTQWTQNGRQEQGLNAAPNNVRAETSTGGAQRNINAEAESASAAQPQYVRQVNEKQVKTCIRVKYRGYKLFALLDTGSDITIAGRDIADRCGWELEEREVAPIKVATDEQLVIDGVATVPLRVGNQSTTTDVLVTRDINGLIMGDFTF